MITQCPLKQTQVKHSHSVSTECNTSLFFSLFLLTQVTRSRFTRLQFTWLHMLVAFISCTFIRTEPETFDTSTLFSACNIATVCVTLSWALRAEEEARAREREKAWSMFVCDTHVSVCVRGGEKWTQEDICYWVRHACSDIYLWPGASSPLCDTKIIYTFSLHLRSRAWFYA